MKTAISIAMIMTTATAIPAGVIPPPESFFELVGVSAAVRGFVGTAVLEVDEALLVMVVVRVDELSELELAEVGVVADEEEDDSDLVDVRTAGSGIVVNFSSSSSSSLSSSSSFGSEELVGFAELSSESVAVGVGSILNTLETKLSRGSRTCRSSSGIARTQCNKKKDTASRDKCLIVANQREKPASDTLPGWRSQQECLSTKVVNPPYEDLQAAQLHGQSSTFGGREPKLDMVAQLFGRGFRLSGTTNFRSP